MTKALPWMTVLARTALAAIFLVAAVPKLLEPAAFAEDIANYQLLPDAWVGLVAAGLPAFEVVVAIALLLGVASRGAALLTAAMLVGFVIGMGQAMARGIALDCGCFGALAESTVGWVSVARNVGLLGLAAFVMWRPEPRWGDLVPPRAIAP